MIFFGDIIAALDVVNPSPFMETPIDSTDFRLRRVGSQFEVLREGHQVGRLTALLNGSTIYLGKMHVHEQYRGTGLSNLLVQIAMVHGLRSGATLIGLNEDSENSALGFWSRTGIPGVAGQSVPLAQAMRAFETSMEAFALNRGISRDPQTVLLDVQARAIGPTRARAKSR